MQNQYRKYIRKSICMCPYKDKGR